MRESAAIFCGPGNNGGDGLAVARHLSVRGWEVRIFLVTNATSSGGRRGGSARASAARSSCRSSTIGAEKELRVALEAAAECDVVVDALFGTGLARPLDGLFARVVEGINGLAVPCVAVDLPSGLAGERAAADRPARARRT